jgi:16S rRNA (cytosine967-C5)-methyltransferase
MRIELDALVLVEKGMSEKTSVTKALQGFPEFQDRREKVLEVVMDAVSKQDLLDRIVRFAVPELRLAVKEQCLARLTALIVITRPESWLGMTSALRDLCPSRVLNDLECLLGCLRNFDLDQAYDGLVDAERIGLLTHHPPWWVEYCLRIFGRKEAIDVLNFQGRPRYVRVNVLRNEGRSELPSRARRLRGVLEPIEDFPGIYRLSGKSSDLSSFHAEGLFQFQDLASWVTVQASEPKAGETVLDLCAAPGAKTAALAALMGNRGRIVSVDYSMSRMLGWKREMGRLGVEIASPVVADASSLPIIAQHDAVLVDPPCSGSGIFDRNPRMKWRVSQMQLDRYRDLQRRMLEEAYQGLRPEGRIVYSTCSLSVEENETVVSRFLAEHSEMETRPIPSAKGKGSPGLCGLKDCKRFYPHRDGTQGYFVARLERSR